MKTLELEQGWLQKLLPEGLPYPTSTLISGPGGTGKPLVELAFVSSWLRAGFQWIAKYVPGLVQSDCGLAYYLL